MEKAPNVDSENAKELRAANILCSMNRSNEEPEAIDQLVKVMDQVQNQNNKGDGSSSSSSIAIYPGNVASTSPSAAADYDRLPAIGRNIEGIELPRFPPQEKLRGIIGECSEAFAKQLTPTDMNRCQSRVSFSKEDVRRAIFPFLNLQSYDRELKDGIEVSVYDPRGEEYTMTFKTWAEHKVYVLSGTTWFQLVNDNNLRKLRDWLNVWVFKNKINGRLCFAIDVQSFDTPQLIKKKRAKKVEEEQLTNHEAPSNGGNNNNKKLRK